MLSLHVLVLNQNYEPLSVCTLKRAIVMVYLDRAEVIETVDGYKIHSVSMSLPAPSVVRLAAYIRVPNKRIMLSRKNVIKRDGGICQYCGCKVEHMTVDHVIPKIRGGKDVWENLVASCQKCNNRKGQRTPEQAKMKLLSKPKRPNHITFIQKFVGVKDYRWRQYLFMD
ncbi:MAG: HNH endonuclease [candidate division Zixibacteria bacterium]|nr:HNH endonuclease [candidate division Zixibacteria bacterium]